MHQEQPEKAAYAHKEYNLREERIKPFMHLQMAVAKRETDLHPEISALEWLEAYADAYRKLVDENPKFIDRFEDISRLESPKKENELEILLDEVRKQLFH